MNCTLGHGVPCNQLSRLLSSKLLACAVTDTFLDLTSASPLCFLRAVAKIVVAPSPTQGQGLFGLVSGVGGQRFATCDMTTLDNQLARLHLTIKLALQKDGTIPGGTKKH